MTPENAHKEKLGDSFAVFLAEVLNLVLLGSINRKFEILPLDATSAAVLACVFILIWLAVIVIEIRRKNYKCYYAYFLTIINIGFLMAGW